MKMVSSDRFFSLEITTVHLPKFLAPYAGIQYTYLSYVLYDKLLHI